MATFEKRGAVVRTRRMWLLAAALLAPLACIVLGVLVAVLDPTVMIGIGFAVEFAMLVAFHRRLYAQRLDLAADPDGILGNGKRLARRSAIRTAHVQAHDSKFVVRLDRWMRPLEVDVGSEEEGRALVAALRLDGESAVVRYLLCVSTYRSTFVRMPVALVITLAPALVDMRFLLFCYLVLAAYMTHQFCTVRMGADGLRFQRWLGRTRFLRYGEIHEAATMGPDVHVKLHSGETVIHHLGGGRLWGWWLRDIEHTREGFVARVNERIAAHESAAGTTAQDALARNGRPVDEWLRGISDGSNAKMYREAAPPPEVLWRVVESTTALPTARAAAAIALRTQLDSAERARLTRIAGACAAPKLRVALEKIASDADDDTIVRALEPLDDFTAARA